MAARYLIGIVLGTTNSAVAFVDTEAADPRVRVKGATSSPVAPRSVTRLADSALARAGVGRLLMGMFGSRRRVAVSSGPSRPGATRQSTNAHRSLAK